MDFTHRHGELKLHRTYSRLYARSATAIHHTSKTYKFPDINVLVEVSSPDVTPVEAASSLYHPISPLPNHTAGVPMNSMASPFKEIATFPSFRSPDMDTVPLTPISGCPAVKTFTSLWHGRSQLGLPQGSGVPEELQIQLSPRHGSTHDKSLSLVRLVAYTTSL